MPKVGKKEFPYTEAGVEAAEQYAEGTNQKIDTSRNYPSSNNYGIWRWWKSKEISFRR